MAKIGALKNSDNKEVHFYSDISEVENNEYDIIFTSGAIQYFPNPDELLEKVFKIPHSLLIVDRLPLRDIDKNWLAVQKYENRRYPSWFFSKKWWENFVLKDRYQIILSWEILEDSPYFEGDKKALPYKGFCYEAKI